MKQTKTYQNTKLLRQLKLRLRKQDSSFLYFILEANEGLAFYSTLKNESLDPLYRDVVVYSTPEFGQALNSLLEHFQKETETQVLSDTYILDNGLDTAL